MSIRMLGIDHNKASIEEREVFSFTKKRAAEALVRIRDSRGILGCVILSTCNRMELWVSCEEEYDGSVYELLCEIKGVDGGRYGHCFVMREGMEAIRHLFYLACGMKSRITGEDQVLTQVKEALEFSRENYGTDKVLEVLFRMAVTSAKQVKTRVHLSAANTSIIHHVIHELKCSGYRLQGRKCLVIGNGAMGKLAAMSLKEEGAEVTVTVRQYRSGMVEIPRGCRRIHYGERLTQLADCDLIISATASPNMTLSYEALQQIEFTSPKVLIDLAVPRDIEPEIGRLRNITLYDIDHFQAETPFEEMKEQMAEIDTILKGGMDEFINWYECKDMIPIVQTVSESAATDVGLRIGRTIRQLAMEEEEKELLEASIHAATDKVLRKLMFGIRDTVSASTFQECMEALKHVY